MRAWDKKRRVLKCYDASAQVYDIRYAKDQTAKIQAALRNLELQDFGYVLDAGCGTGILLDHLGNRASAFIGVDVSRRSLFKAKTRAKDSGETHLICADVDNMPLEGQFFNMVFAITLLQNMPSPAKTLKQIVRVSRDNAFFVITGLKKIFDLKSFQRLLTRAGFDVVALEGDSMECYVAVCRRAHLVTV